MDRELRCFFSAMSMLIMGLVCGMIVAVAQKWGDWMVAGIFLVGARVMGEMAWEYFWEFIRNE